jgi:hypothetical protein
VQRYFTVMCLASSGKQPAHRANQEAEILSNARIFTQDSDVPSSDRADYISTDNVAAGRRA